ncbi:hypothetical protein [Legionella maioricensis]|uniref:Purine NTPase n=1 Tax=Legionella maioricensis TaxID=2896528 RepID=A0A9X2IBT1_9GAMM|nr:hypothetical protein [Legionella maioricensis]MCL9684725.1 hypothetical protein [Legionella maioricensis]MCL9687753.1 hypothetical protein [Legionella maioricensis]
MLAKRERFGEWRGKKADEEQNILESALLVSDYVNSVKQLDAIRVDFLDSQSEQYVALNRYEKRSYGALLYCKLQIEEALDEIPVTRITERVLLSDLSNIIEEIYDNPRYNAAQKAADLITKTKKLLNLNPRLLADKKLAKALCFDLYTLLNIMNLSMSQFSWWQTMAVNALVDLNKIKEEVTILLRMTEDKVKQLDKILDESSMTQDIDERVTSSEYGDEGKEETASLLGGKAEPLIDPVKNTIQDYFNADFLALIKSSNTEDEEFILVEDRMNKVIEGLNRLISKRNKKESIRLKIEKVQSLFNAVEENDKKIRDRQYFLELINSNFESFNLLMDKCKGLKKEQLVEKIEQLKNPLLYQQVLRRVSQATSTITLFYRVCTPQKVQDAVISQIPTLDSECKARLKDLACAGISTLNQEYSVTDREIAILNHQLSNENIELEKLIAQESTDNLILLVKANSAARDALQRYRAVSDFLTGMVWHLNVIKESTGVLTQFIQTHDGFLVRLSNFFAQIFSLFKSDTAVMIDSAREMKEHLARFEVEYKNELAKELSAIVHHPDINQEIKDRLQEKISIEITSETQIIPYTSPSKAEVRYLTRSLEELFNMNSASRVTEPDDSILEQSFSPSLF